MSLSPVIEAVVDSKVQNNELFTAHDVTREVRNRGHRASHDEVRDGVHDYFQRGGLGVAYTRTNIPVPGGHTPYLYHRTVDDPSLYQNIRGAATATSGPSIIPIPPIITSSDDNDDDDENDDDDDENGQIISIPSSFNSNMNVGGIAVMPKTSVPSAKPRSVNPPGTKIARKVDGRGTLSIPTDMIRKVGFGVKQNVWVVLCDNKVLVSSVTSWPGSSTQVFGKYTVDKNQQVRVTQSALTKAGIGGNQYDLEVVDDKVVVKPHQTALQQAKTVV